MKETIALSIKKQISYYKNQLGKYDFSETIYEHKERGRLEGIIFGLEQALISVNNG